eukprot:2162688-Karenia_brevis.AAC.1
MYDHVCRAHFNEPNVWLVRVLDVEWLNSARSSHSSTEPGRSRTGSRAGPGYVAQRWEEGIWLYANDIQKIPKKKKNQDKKTMIKNNTNHESDARPQTVTTTVLSTFSIDSISTSMQNHTTNIVKH